jgi:hypothetical protein
MLSCMQGGRRLAASLALLACACGLATACGSSDKTSGGGLGSGNSKTGGSGGSGATGGATGASGGSSATSANGGGSSGTISVSGGTSGTTGSAGEGTQCGGDEYEAMLVPLDLYVMLDSSGSMFDTVGTATKWDAIGSALTSFINDPASAGIGIGLQFFPQHDPNVPTTCTTIAQCGTDNLCLANFCKNAGPKFYVCDTDNDCIQNGQSYGPCSPFSYCQSSGGATPCHNDQDCTGGRGDCVVYGNCSGNVDFTCPTQGSACTLTTGQSLGTCGPPVPQCQHTANCDPTVYATPAAEIAELPGAAANVSSVIAQKMPDGQTPTAPALEGAIDHARTWAQAHTGHTVAVLLATDGLPTECIADPTNDPTGIDGVATTAQAGVSGTPSIETFVIGVFSQADNTQLMAGSNLDQIAMAGGSQSATIVGATGDVEQQFVDALDAIRGTRLPCNFQIPTPTSGSFDQSQVNVVFTQGDSKQTLYYWPNAAACDANDGGWYYDNPTAPTTIIACPTSCTAFQSASADASSGAKVSIELGCRTVVK